MTKNTEAIKSATWLAKSMLIELESLSANDGSGQSLKDAMWHIERTAGKLQAMLQAMVES